MHQTGSSHLDSLHVDFVDHFQFSVCFALIRGDKLGLSYMLFVEVFLTICLLTT